MSIKLSENFTDVEMYVTSQAIHNVPNRYIMEKLQYLCVYLLQPIRDKWGSLEITSGYRSAEVNKSVGGSLNSQHMSGEAADFIHPNLGAVYNWIIMESRLKYGQCILENKGGNKWVHISLPRLNMPNGQSLFYNGKDYSTYTA